MSLIEHAERELNIAFASDGSPDTVDYNKMVKRDVMQLIKVFSEQGHSGFSAPYVARLFKTLANYETLTDITGKDLEWGTRCDPNQNNRNSKIFRKYNADGSVYYTYNDAIIFKSASGTCWGGSTTDSSGNKVSSGIFSIKAFPFIPKTFYIDVVDVNDETGEFCNFKIVDETQLNAVAEYYDRVDGEK